MEVEKIIIEANAKITELENQRNDGFKKLTEYATCIAFMEKEREELKAQIEELKAQLQAKDEEAIEDGRPDSE